MPVKKRGSDDSASDATASAPSSSSLSSSPEFLVSGAGTDVESGKELVSAPASVLESALSRVCCCCCCTDLESDTVIRRPQQFKLFHRDETPEFLREDHILTGYRVHFSAALCVQSVFRLHNETLNIWTHLAGFFVFLGMYIYTLTLVLPVGLFDAALVLSAFMIGVMICMLCSATFHVFLCHSERMYTRLLRADLTGVSAQIFGSFVPGLYFGFACQPIWRAVYLSLVSLSFIMGIVAPHIPRFNTRQCLLGRVLMYASMAAFGVIPFGHWLLTRGLVDERHHRAIALFAVVFALYGLGVVFYISRFPERLRPGKFDIWLHSHQWWHLCVFAAPLVYFFVSLDQLALYAAAGGQCPM